MCAVKLSLENARKRERGEYKGDRPEGIRIDIYRPRGRRIPAEVVCIYRKLYELECRLFGFCSGLSVYSHF